MNRQQAHALFNLIVTLLIVFTFFALLPLIGLRRAQASLALMSVLALGCLFYRRRRPEEVLTDERDRIILLKANTVTGVVGWLFFVASMMVPWALFHQRGSVPADLLPALLNLGFIVFLLTHALTILLQYRRA